MHAKKRNQDSSLVARCYGPPEVGAVSTYGKKEKTSGQGKKIIIFVVNPSLDAKSYEYVSILRTMLKWKHRLSETCVKMKVANHTRKEAIYEQFVSNRLRKRKEENHVSWYARDKSLLHKNVNSAVWRRGSLDPWVTRIQLTTGGEEKKRILVVILNRRSTWNHDLTR